ncbi:DUF4913 domain-containing protein [Streptomonospora nanhaiensis]|uniref:DUF4913 domain-containing protein n=1 Tax=Streptomonospora nanhaiensis TaxID=1323731 RepID=A0A853BMP7_9ACTN|nr:DUF4913 domain-containing protein [Streptomonospora nanhaiensis]MBX9390526.1 DUF4913 domain-containing protein [Streptomonospora nanhaiensis]NYI96290.1 hypothetical protein [Streptomonospora nanhaiensis]
MTSTDDRMLTDDGLSERVTNLQNAMHRLGADVIRLQTQLSELAAPPRPEEAADDRPEPTPFIFNMSRDAYKGELADLVRWVNDFLVPVYVGEPLGQTADGTAWCPVWWEHHEAVGRLHALRLAYDELADTRVAGPSGPGVWHRDHLDPVLDRLRSANGPFAACSRERGHVERRRSASA